MSPSTSTTFPSRDNIHATLGPWNGKTSVAQRLLLKGKFRLTLASLDDGNAYGKNAALHFLGSVGTSDHEWRERLQHL